MTANLFVSLAVSAAFAYLYSLHRERYLVYWCGGLALWSVRYLLGLVLFPVSPRSADLLIPLFSLATGTAYLAGAMHLSRRPFPRVWTVLVALDLLWFLAFALASDVPSLYGATGVPHFALFAAAFIWSGITFIRAGDGARAERTATGVVLIAMGLLQALFPFAPWMSPATQTSAFYFALTAQVFIAVGVLATHHQSVREEAERLHSELEAALTRVLGAYLPICAHCKSIRDTQGEWRPLEQYVHRETGTQFSHGICPSCFQANYGEVSATAETPTGPVPNG